MPPIRKIDSGYEGAVPDDFNFPSVGIENIDRALFDLFNDKISFEVEVNSETTKVPVVFAAGERFALTRRKQPIRDKNNALILPIIAIKRNNIDHSPSQAGYGTPISFRSQQSYVIRKKLSSKDRDYQNILNKLALKNQNNLPSRGHFAGSTLFPGNSAKPGTVASRRQTSALSFIDSPHGNLLRPDISNNIFEIITIPYPRFIALEYEITFWTQYMQQMNQIIETMFAQFTGQGHEFQISTPEGFYFVAYIKSPLSSADNFTDFSSEERIIRYTFNVTIPGYILAPRHPGLPDPVRKFLSAPQIEFGYNQASAQVVTPNQFPYFDGNEKKFILSDVEDINSKGDPVNQRGESSERVVETVIDPFTGKETKRQVKVLQRNQRAGETVASSRIIIKLEDTLD